MAILTSKITRLFNFAPKQEIKSTEMNPELNQIISQISNVVDDLTALDTEKAAISYVEAALIGVTQGAVADGSITDAKLSNGPTDVKARLLDVESDILTLTNANTSLSSRVTALENNTPPRGNSTIPTSGWVVAVGDYPISVNVALPGVRITDFLLVSIDGNCEDVASAAGLSSQNSTYDGGVTFYAKTAPTEAITFTYYSLG